MRFRLKRLNPKVKSSDYIIRQGEEGDFSQVDKFDPFAGNRKQEIIDGYCLVAVCEGRVIGFLTYHPSGFIRRPFVRYLSVHESFRRSGVANLLLNVVAERIKHGRLFISTEEDNIAMLHLLKEVRWTLAGCVSNVNDGDRAECFFFKDL